MHKLFNIYLEKNFLSQFLRTLILPSFGKEMLTDKRQKSKQ